MSNLSVRTWLAQNNLIDGDTRRALGALLGKAWQKETPAPGRVAALRIDVVTVGEYEDHFVPSLSPVFYGLNPDRLFHRIDAATLSGSARADASEMLMLLAAADPHLGEALQAADRHWQQDAYASLFLLPDIFILTPEYVPTALAFLDAHHKGSPKTDQTICTVYLPETETAHEHIAFRQAFPGQWETFRRFWRGFCDGAQVTLETPDLTRIDD